MENIEESGSRGWGASLFIQTTEDMARTVGAAATAARSPRPSVVFSSKDDSGSPLQKLQRQFSRVLKGLSHPPEVKSGPYNPEILTSQKRQWASLQLQSLDNRILTEPSRLFESMVVVGLHPNCDFRALEKQYFSRKSEGTGRFRSAPGSNHCVEPNLEPQVLFVYPPEKPLPLTDKGLVSFCFPGGIEVRAVERTPSMSELNEILLGQEHLKQSDQSFVFRLQVADDSTLYGCCVFVEELVHKTSGLISMTTDSQPLHSNLSRHILVTQRCYCILSRLPFFELHFGVLNSIFTSERLERLTRNLGDLDFGSNICYHEEQTLDEKSDNTSMEHKSCDLMNGTRETFQSSMCYSFPPRDADDESQLEHQIPRDGLNLSNKCINSNVLPFYPEPEKLPPKSESPVAMHFSKACDSSVNDIRTDKQPAERHLPNAVFPLLRYQQYESSESSTSFQSSPSEDRNFRSDVDDLEVEEASFSGQEDCVELSDLLEWAKANKHESLQIICEYYQLHCPGRGSGIEFHPLLHLHPLEFQRPNVSALNISGSAINLDSCSTSLELAEVHSALMVEEEATALAAWAVACICGSLRLEHVLTLLAGALLEKQIVVVCSNLGKLSASVLSIIPLIRPYQWQSLLMPVLPNDMLDFLDAPVPYIVGMKNKTAEVQSKLTNVILVDANKNQVKAPIMPQLPKQKELFSCLSPYHAKLVGESYLGERRPVHECTDEQVEAARGFLGIIRPYLESICSNLRSHTITNVQSNDDKVSLLLKESFIESFPSRDRPFMKQFVETQLFSVHTDLVLSFFQKE